MKKTLSDRLITVGLMLCLVAMSGGRLTAAPATLLFEDNFDSPADYYAGWTAVQPVAFYLGNGNYDLVGRWVYDSAAGGWAPDGSNIYTDNANNSPSATAVMLINDAVAGDTFTYSARLRAGDDDGFGLVFGYKDDVNYYRASFVRQSTGARFDGNFPGVGWEVDRKVDDVQQILHGHMPGMAADPAFILTDAVPFDVTVTVTAGNVLTLTIVDDPDGAAVAYTLVDGVALPTSAAGRVGMFSWGMSGGGPPTGFLISNLDLQPVGLVNPNPGSPVASAGWAEVITAGPDGESVIDGHGAGLWGYHLSPNGLVGSLTETSDAFRGSDNAGNDDAASFSATTMVNGDENWDNYVLTTEIRYPDDDGVGVVLRFQNVSNFYRVAFRTQNSANGVARGLSVMKQVGGQFDLIFSQSAGHFLFPNDAPFQVLTAIQGQLLRVVVISDPEGASIVDSFGPFDMTGTNGVPNLATGKIGVWAWAAGQVDFNFVRVEQVNGVPLIVSSAFGTPSPGTGLQDFSGGTLINASVDALVSDTPGTRRANIGFTGFGSVPTSGAMNSVDFTMDQFSLLTWLWRTEHQVTVTAGAGGTVMTPAEWQPEGTNVTITATPNVGFVLGGWSGDTIAVSPSLNVPIFAPFSATANFEADSDMDGLPDSFETANFGNLDMDGTGDPDMDGSSNLEEFQKGTDPNFAESVVSEDGLFASQWINPGRDVALPGQFGVQDFVATNDIGLPFRGPYELSNDFRRAGDDPLVIPVPVDNVSYDGPRMVVREELWDESWSNFTAQVIFSVGDNDGNCVYWRYQDESNYYRLTITGEDDSGTLWRAPRGASVHKRVGDDMVLLASDVGFLSDPDDGLDTDPNPPNLNGWKRFRATVTADGENHTVFLEGWDVFTEPHNWSPFATATLAFSDPDLANGRLGVGTWGQGGDNNVFSPTPDNPVDDGALLEAITVEVNAAQVFSENWSSTPVQDVLPTGWENPYVGTSAEGDWRVSAHGTIFQLDNFGPATSSTDVEENGDADGLVLLAPDQGVPNHAISIGFHPFDDDSIGFVYDFVDTNNYARVLFTSAPSGAGVMPQGLNVSRKSAGVWSDIVSSDKAFIYTPASPFAIDFANNNGQLSLAAWELDNPGSIVSWRWSDQRPTAGNRYGLACWAEQDAHFLYATARDLPAKAVTALEITSVTIDVGLGTISLGILNTTGSAYDVLVSPDVTNPANWGVAAGGAGQNGAVWNGTLPAGVQSFWELRSVAP